MWCVGALLVWAALPLQQLGQDSPLAHVEAGSAIPGLSAGVPSILRWWCGDKAHAAGPLCVRHEIALQMARASGAERRSSHAQRQSLLGDAAMRELKQALAVFCERSRNVTTASNTSGHSICAELEGGRSGAGSLHTGPPPRAMQLIEMNRWWCVQPGRNDSLGCHRHALQLAHQAATSEQEREAVRLQLEALLATASPVDVERLRQDTHMMQLEYCADPKRSALEICRFGSESSTHAEQLSAGGGRLYSRGRNPSFRKGRPKGTSSGRPKGPDAVRKASRLEARWSTKESFASLKTWWCSGPVPHPSDSRCAESTVWTGKVAQGVRFVFCERPNTSFPAALFLCDAEAGGHGQRYGSPRSSGNKQHLMHRPGILRLTGVCVVLGGMMLAAVACGWNLKKHVGKRSEDVSESVRAVAISSGRPGVRSRLAKRLQVVHEVPSSTTRPIAVTSKAVAV
mmetsp:Transcript_20313/g.61863  ORF Transcript_20313/g.61863 Transcript_20313/m.61863 type:complete len:456 (+) Transcript_20313:28-1395(+)